MTVALPDTKLTQGCSNSSRCVGFVW